MEIIYICSGAAIIILLLIIKIFLLKASVKEINDLMTEKLSTDTNTLICISSSDKEICALASNLNVQLKELRRQKLRYEQGNNELKNAVTNISHDLRTPLTAIISYLELLERAEKGEEAERYTEIIKERAEALSQLTEELFRYSVIISNENGYTIEKVTINNVLEESILGFYAALQQRNIEPDINITENKIVRYIDRASLVRIFSNLISNAIKYSDGDLNISMTDDGTITFSNKAKGLDEVRVKRLFDRFYTVENAGKSTGLGLSIARTLIEKMNGTIDAEYKNENLIITLSIPQNEQ